MVAFVSDANRWKFNNTGNESKGSLRSTSNNNKHKKHLKAIFV